MKIAYYGAGNVSDPLGAIHNEKGEPLLEQDEKILVTKENIRCDIHISKRTMWILHPIFSDTGKGTFYRTNKRLIYIREPQPSHHIGELRI